MLMRARSIATMMNITVQRSATHCAYTYIYTCVCVCVCCVYSTEIRIVKVVRARAERGKIARGARVKRI